MVSVTYEALALRWTPRDKTDHTFNITVAVTLCLFLALEVIVLSIDVPVEERRTQVPLRDEVMVNLKEKSTPIPKVVEPPKPTEKPMEESEIKRPRDEARPLTKEQAIAREKVEKIGIFKMKDQLTDLVETASARNVVSQTIAQTGAGSQAAAANTNILTSSIGKPSIGVSETLHSPNTGSARLETTSQAAAQQVAQTAIKESPKVSSEKTAAVADVGIRAEEDVVSVLDQNKGTLNTLYRKARRSNPGLKGRLVLEITVQPNGSVSNVIVKSSELNDPSLEESIIARVKLLDFGVRKGEARTVIYPIEFLPG